MKRIILAAVMLTLIGVLWVGGELHRQNCVQEHRTGCSVLPWVSGSEVVDRTPSLSGSSYLLPSNGYLLDNARAKSLWP